MYNQQDNVLNNRTPIALLNNQFVMQPFRFTSIDPWYVVCHSNKSRIDSKTDMSIDKYINQCVYETLNNFKA